MSKVDSYRTICGCQTFQYFLRLLIKFLKTINLHCFFDFYKINLFSKIDVITPGIPATVEMKIVNILKLKISVVKIPIAYNDKIPDPGPNKITFHMFLHLI